MDRMSRVYASAHDYKLETWLTAAGFEFDPFQHLEASGDARLGEYLIGHESFAAAWAEAPTCIFAPAGGGKTALHVYTSRACWVGVGAAHPFPIPYLLPSYRFTHRPPDTAAHFKNLVQAGVMALLIGLAFRPERFLALGAPEQRTVAVFLAAMFPGSFQRYLAILRESWTPAALPPLLHRAYVLPNPPDVATLMTFCDTLDAAVPTQEPHLPEPRESFTYLVELILNVLGFRSILALIDGADAFPETSDDPHAAAEWLSPLFVEAAPWAQSRVYLKSFLPIEMEPILYGGSIDFMSDISRIRLTWSQDMLADLIRKRVHVGSGGKFNSLDALSSLELRDNEDVETSLAGSVVPLPREMLALVRQVLLVCAQRTNGAIGYLEQGDIETALARYRV